MPRLEVFIPLKLIEHLGRVQVLTLLLVYFKVEETDIGYHNLRLFSGTAQRVIESAYALYLLGVLTKRHEVVFREIRKKLSHSNTILRGRGSLSTEMDIKKA